MTRPAKIAGWVAAGLSALWFLVHTFVGGAGAAGPLLASDLPIEVRAPVWMTWHMVTGTLALMTALFALGLWQGRRDLVVAATGLSAVIALAGLLAAPLTGAGYGLLPQGFLFIPILLAGLIVLRGMPSAP